MRKLRTTLLAVALVSTLVPSITVPAQADPYGWWGGGGLALGLATATTIGGAIASSYPYGAYGAYAYYPGYGPKYYDPRVYATYCVDLLWCTGRAHDGAYRYRYRHRYRH